MDRFESMSIFVSVVEAGSLSASSRKLGIPLATVSRKLSELEAHLGIRLLNRSTRRLDLTDAGHAYFAATKRILDDVDTAERMATGEYTTPKGDLVVTAPIVFGRLHILPLVAEFLIAYPEINIQLVLTDKIVDMMEEHIDLAVRIGELPDSTMMGARVGFVRRVTCASPGYLAARGIPVHPEKLSTLDCIAFEVLGSPRAWPFFHGKEKITVAIRPRLIVSTAEAGIDAAMAGVGITRALSYQVERAVNCGDLKIILEKFEPPAWPIHIVHHGTRILPLKLRSFRDFVVPRLKERLIS